MQRGRDHQLPTYPSYRAYCGFKKPETWTDMTDLISPDHVHRLFHIYASPADVDLYIGQGPNSIDKFFALPFVLKNCFSFVVVTLQVLTTEFCSCSW